MLASARSQVIDSEMILVPIPSLTVRGIHSQIDGDWGNPFIGARHPVCLGLYLLSHFCEVCILLPFLVQKLRPLCLGMVKLQHQWSSGDNT